MQSRLNGDVVAAGKSEDLQSKTKCAGKPEDWDSCRHEGASAFPLVQAIVDTHKLVDTDEVCRPGRLRLNRAMDLAMSWLILSPA